MRCFIFSRNNLYFDCKINQFGDHVGIGNFKENE